MLDGKPIEDVDFSGKMLHINVTSYQRYSEYEACVGAGLDLEKWEYGGYSKQFKAGVVAWYVAHVLVEQHGMDRASRGK